MYKYHLLLLCAFTILFSCSKHEGVYQRTSCRMEIKEGSVFTLYDESLNPIDDLIFKENVTFYGERMDYLPEGDKQVYFIEDIDTIFPKTGIRFNDLAITIEDDNITWIKNNSSETNFCFENIDYCVANDSVCHFKCYGDKRSHCFTYSIYDMMIHIQADIKLSLMNY